MNTDKFIKIVLMDLTSDLLKVEAELESIMNSEKSLTLKTEQTKKLLKKMVSIENSISKFNSLIGNDNNNKE